MATNFIKVKLSEQIAAWHTVFTAVFLGIGATQLSGSGHSAKFCRRTAYQIGQRLFNFNAVKTALFGLKVRLIGFNEYTKPHHPIPLPMHEIIVWADIICYLLPTASGSLPAKGRRIWIFVRAKIVTLEYIFTDYQLIKLCNCSNIYYLV